MRLEVQYTEADFREAQGEAWGQKAEGKSPTIAAIGWFLVVVSAPVWWWAMRPTPKSSPPGAPQPPVQDLLVTLLPNTVLALFVLTIPVAVMAANASMSRRRMVFGNQARNKLGHMGRFMALFSVLMIIASAAVPMLLPVVHWRPSRFEALVAGFAPWLLVIFLLVFVFTWYAKAMIRVAWEQNPALRRPHVLEFSNEGMANSDEHGTSSHRWAAFLRYRETENLYILVMEDARFLMVPKRAFADQMTMLEFRALIATKISEGYFLTQPQGAFAVLPPPPLVKSVEISTGGQAASGTQTT